MCEENCSGKCEGCHGCSEKVILSNNPEINFVSSLTFPVRNFSNSESITLITECAKTDEKGKCFAGIKFYKNGELMPTENTKLYEIPFGEMSQKNFNFTPNKHADKAEVIIYCEGGATLDIEHINIKK